jgi:NADH dehydrogenase FAD-containing subunit
MLISGRQVRPLPQRYPRCKSDPYAYAVSPSYLSGFSSRFREIFEIASGPGLTDQQRHDILQIRVVGGGPTGVEYAAELHDFVISDVERMYPQLKGKIGITLYDVAPGILMSFDEYVHSLKDIVY